MLVLIKMGNMTLLIEIDGAIFRGYDLFANFGSLTFIRRHAKHFKQVESSTYGHSHKGKYFCLKIKLKII
jgi:hypothetical protein